MKTLLPSAEDVDCVDVRPFRRCMGFIWSTPEMRRTGEFGAYDGAEREYLDQENEAPITVSSLRARTSFTGVLSLGAELRAPRFKPGLLDVTIIYYCHQLWIVWV